jgi:hypothetical protein
MTVPACAEDEYSVVIPTLCDSTISEGQYYTTFFVRALTDTPGIHFDSYPDSGYSLDNLAPGPPPNLRMTSPTQLAWDEALEQDFDYFAVYGSGLAELDESAVLLGWTIDTAWDVSGDTHDYYHVTATDFAGNEGSASNVENTYAGVRPEADLPRVFALVPSRPNPFTTGTTIGFHLPVACGVRLDVFDTEGKVVRLLLEEEYPAGLHSLVWDGENDAGTVAGPGIYFVRLRAGTFSATCKTLRMR